MQFDTVTEFLEQYDKCYELPTLGHWSQVEVVYRNKETGEFEIFDNDLDYQGAMLPWVSFSGQPQRRLWACAGL